MNATPILIYAPAYAAHESNSAPRIADIIARLLDDADPEATYTAEDRADVAAPRGLSNGRSIVRTDTSVSGAAATTALQVFELDYRPDLVSSDVPWTGPVGPGLVKSGLYAVRAVIAWWGAVLRRSKGWQVKTQLALGGVVVAALVFTFLAGLYCAALAVVGHPFGPDALSGLLGQTPAQWTLGSAALGWSVSWPALRTRVLGLADLGRVMVDICGGDGTSADTPHRQLAGAIDGLRQTGWSGKVHLLGYSLGGLLLYEAMFPKRNSLVPKDLAGQVDSLVTIGLPIDLVRLYNPRYVQDRTPQIPNLVWVNIFNAADLLASNLLDGDDTSTERSRSHNTPPQVTPPGSQIRFTDEGPSWWRLLALGRTHMSYWSTPQANSCFGPLLTRTAPGYWDPGHVLLDARAQRREERDDDHHA